MLYDVVTPSSYRTFNVTIAQIIGLVNAVYCSELLDIYSKARRKNTIDDNGFFPLNRNYVKLKTSIKIDEQYLCDVSLSKIGLVETSKESPDTIKFNVEQFMNIIAENDSKVLSQIYKKVTLPRNETEAKALKREKQKIALKNLVDYDNDEVKNSLIDWVEVVFENCDITKETVKDFQRVLKEYTKSNTKIALQLVAKAKAFKLIKCIDAIKQYEEEQETLKSKKQVRATNFKVATSDNLSDKRF